MENAGLPPEERRESVRRLWKECFNDTDKFIDFYFSRVYSPQVDYSEVRDGRVVSAMQCIPYRMLCGGNAVRVGYLSGVCTSAAYRRRGLAGGLVARSVGDMSRRGFTFAFLIPAGSGVLPFYRRYGFFIAMRKRAVPVPRNGSRGSAEYSAERVAACSGGLYALFARRQKERRGFALLHDSRQFRTVTDEWLMDGGLILTASLGGKPVSYLFARPSAPEKTLYIYDAPPADCPAFSFLTEKAAGIYPEYVVRKYAMRSRGGFPVCARIINARSALAAYAALHPGEDRRIRVYGDKLIGGNNGLYAISGGKCARVATQTGGRGGHCGSFTAMTLAQLARMVFSGGVSFNFLLE